MVIALKKIVQLGAGDEKTFGKAGQGDAFIGMAAQVIHVPVGTEPTEHGPVFHVMAVKHRHRIGEIQCIRCLAEDTPGKLRCTV